MKKLDELIKCREVICGKTYDKSNMLEILRSVDVRYELWKYYDVCGHTIRNWLQMPFRKVRKTMYCEKIKKFELESGLPAKRPNQKCSDLATLLEIKIF